MKKILIPILLFAIVSCGNDSKDKIKTEVSNGAGCVDIQSVEVKGHEYIIYHGYHQGGIVHSASCPCQLKTLEDSLSYFEDGM